MERKIWSDATTHEAGCSCGQLRLKAAGEPKMVVACSCKLCQLRTGSAFSVHAMYLNEAIEVTGKFSSYSRLGDSGRNVVFNFCPNCGATLFWSGEMRPELTVVAAGAFDDSSFIRTPDRLVFAGKQVPWQTWPDTMPRHVEGAKSPLINA